MDEEFQNEANYPEDIQIGLDWALTVDHADGTRQNYSREMLQLYFRDIYPSFDLLFDSQEEAQNFIDEYKKAVVGPGDTIVAERSSFTPQAPGSHDGHRSENRLCKRYCGRPRESKPPASP